MDKFFETLRSIKFRRSRRRIVAGVAGGIADATGWDVTLVRIGLLLSFLLPFIGIVTYLVAWLLLPYEDGEIVLEKIVGSAR